MISTNLFSKVLVEPATTGGDTLYIVSGYASSAMVFHHFEELKKRNLIPKINLLIGMVIHDGLRDSNHRAFQKLMADDLRNRFNCYYLVKRPQVHSKVYTWYQESRPSTAFIGSANYSQNAFMGRQREIMDSCDPMEGLDYYHTLMSEALPCTHKDADDLIYSSKRKSVQKREPTQMDNRAVKRDSRYEGLEHVRVSFINRSGIVSERSGLNWGQRPELGREPNQAYIPLKSEVYRSDFFPPLAQHFSVETDDGEIFMCTRAQENAKAIHTPHDNSLLGRYFRGRLGLLSGSFVTLDQLNRYGRTYVDFYKVDDENYYLDFSEILK